MTVRLTSQLRLDIQGRAQYSPLPFDAEAVFTMQSIATALKDYQAWAKEEGVPYFLNPFHAQDS